MLLARGRSGVGSPEITDSERRHADSIRFGKVAEADYEKARVRVLIGDEDDDGGHLTTGWLPMPGGRARGDSDWHPLEVGERVVVLSESGELQNGIVMPAGLYSDDDPAPGDKAGLWRKRFQDGATLEYDRDSGELLFSAIAKASIKVGDTSIVLSGTSIIMTAGGQTFKLTSAGVESSQKIKGGNGLEVAGGTVTHDGKAIGKTHQHSGVAAGGANTGAPV